MVMSLLCVLVSSRSPMLWMVPLVVPLVVALVVVVSMDQFR